MLSISTKKMLFIPAYIIIEEDLFENFSKNPTNFSIIKTGINGTPFGEKIRDKLILEVKKVGK